MKKREQWDHRMSFILAAVGSAIGLGNIWRFPYVCYKFGGGAFLIPYLIALFTTGMPLMILEFGIGHKMSGGAPKAMGKARKSWEWVGWLALLVAFVISCYYAVIMGWCVRYMGYSVTQAWGSNPSDFFMNTFLKISDKHSQLGSLQWSIVACLIISWIAIVASIWKGVRSVGKVVYVTVVVPWLILLVFLLRSLMLPGAFTGLSYFLNPNFAALLDLEVWSAAFTQVFFSLTLGFGVMFAYASFLPEKTDIVNNAIIISLMDAGTAFVGGLVVFATLGHYAHSSNLPVESVIKAGPSLAFITYPTIISHFPAFSGLIGFLFFFMLFTLGIDSAFSLVESVVTGIMDKFNTRRIPTLIGVGTTGLLLGLFFCFQSGLLWLDIVDHFMNQYGLMTVCLLEVIFVGWVLNTESLRNYINLNSEVKIGKWWDYCLRFFIPVVLTVLLISWLGQRVNGSYENYGRSAEFLGGWLFVLLLPPVAVILTGAIRKGLLLLAILFIPAILSAKLPSEEIQFPAVLIFYVTVVVLFGGASWCIYRSRVYHASTDSESTTQTTP